MRHTYYILVNGQSEQRGDVHFGQADMNDAVIGDTNDANINIRSTVPPVRMNNLENRGVLQLRNHSGKMYWRQQLLNSIINLQF